MGFIKKCLLVSLGFGLAGAIGASFATGTAQAIVAALVQVANTTANPVPSLSVTDPGRVAYQSSGLSCTQTTHCVIPLPTVPSGHRVVVQHISGNDSVSGTTTYVRLLAAVVTPLGEFSASSFYSQFSNTAAFYASDQPVLFYVDAGSHVEVGLVSDGTFQGLGVVTLTGYDLDCTVAACATIAMQ